MAEIEAEVYQLVDRPISCHAWSKNRQCRPSQGEEALSTLFF